ncbi:hypothetical protein HGRIS_013323 [Hohenbuehelia grisea]|uniref:Non-specific serine/threonine protein kinase n=1 Tax=Hohenbuehelia grisea TaxID=104357 RepID=A0ABR3IV48_9AGAR
MSVADLFSNFGIPGLEAGVKLLTETYRYAENIKIYRRQCMDMSNRCKQLLLTLQDSSAGLEGTRTIEFADQVEAIISSINRRLSVWSNFSRSRSLLAQTEIREGIDRFNRDIDMAIVAFNINTNMELSRNHSDLAAMQQRDRAEFRELLLEVMRSTDEVRALLDSRSPEAVDGVMESIQLELHDPTLEPAQEHTFKEGLWKLHESTSKLPPLTNLTGQVTQDSLEPVAMGNFNDIFIGTWLDRTKVALRRPRALINAAGAQNRFQREVSIWRELRHQNIVPFHGVVYIGDNVLSVSSWMDNGTVHQYVKKNPTVDRLRLLSETAAGLEYLHLQRVIHGDLRGTNVLVGADGTARLSDFGLSKLLENINPSMASTSAGTNARWSAPELVKPPGTVSTASDVWAFGMFALELMTEERPFSNLLGDLMVIRELDQGKIPQRPGTDATKRGLSDDIWALMKKCWHKKAQSRPSMTDVRMKLAEIRGVPYVPTQPRPQLATGLSSPSSHGAPEGTAPRHSSSRLSLRRPSTSSSNASIKSSASAKSRLRSFFRLPSSAEADRIHEVEEGSDRSSSQLSPISISASPGGSLHSHPNGIPVVRTPDSDHGTNPNFFPGGNGLPASPQMLSPPAISSSLPSNFGTEWGDRRMASSDSASSPATSDMWSEHSNMENLLRRAVLDPAPILNMKGDGSVISGTLEGLVERLLNHNNLTKDVEYRDILLTLCTDFTSPEELFDIVVRHFNQANVDLGANVELRGAHAQRQVETRVNVMILVTYWVSNHHLDLSPKLRSQMHEFAVTALSERTSSNAMKARAKDIISGLEQRNVHRQESASPLLSPRRKIPRTSDLVPRDVAIAMTLLEGDKFVQILPAGYIGYLRKSTDAYCVDTALAINAQITYWVKRSILRCDAIKDRCEALKFFVNTADECRIMRNFTSMAAVMRALQSDVITRLKVTMEELSPPARNLLEQLKKRLHPGDDASYLGYRQALNEPTSHAARNACIPWLQLHLQDLDLVFRHNRPVTFIDGRPLINFERYSRFTAKLKEILYCKPPDVERFRSQGQLAYLENQLRKIELSDDAEHALEEKSRAHETEERRIRRLRLRERDNLGFRT